MSTVQLNSRLKPSPAKDICNKSFISHTKTSLLQGSGETLYEVFHNKEPLNYLRRPLLHTSNMSDKDLPTNQLTCLQLANLEVFHAYFYKAKFSLHNYIRENLKPTGHLAGPSLVYYKWYRVHILPKRHQMYIPLKRH